MNVLDRLDQRMTAWEDTVKPHQAVTVMVAPAHLRALLDVARAAELIDDTICDAVSAATVFAEKGSKSGIGVDYQDAIMERNLELRAALAPLLEDTDD